MRGRGTPLNVRVYSGHTVCTCGVVVRAVVYHPKLEGRYVRLCGLARGTRSRHAEHCTRHCTRSTARGALQAEHCRRSHTMGKNQKKREPPQWRFELHQSVDALVPVPSPWGLSPTPCARAAPAPAYRRARTHWPWWMVQTRSVTCLGGGVLLAPEAGVMCKHICFFGGLYQRGEGPNLQPMTQVTAAELVW